MPSQDLMAAGIDAHIRPVSWAALLEATRTEKLTPLFFLGWQADFPDPSNFLGVLFHSRGRGDSNASFFSAPRIDRLIDDAAPLAPGPLRVARYEEIEAMLLREVPRVPLYHAASLAMVASRVHGLKLHPMRPERLAVLRLQDSPGPQTISAAARQAKTARRFDDAGSDTVP